MEESRNPANSQTMIGIGTIPPPPPPAEKSQPDIKGSEILSTPPPPPGWAPTQRDTIERAATISVPGFPVITPATPKRINSEQIETNQAVNQTMAFVNEPAKNDPAKKDPVESFPKTPITRLSSSAPAWMERLTSSSEEKAVKPQVDYKTDTAEPKYISETFRNRILGDAKNQVSVAEIYKEMLATKPSGIYNQKTRKALIEECDQVLIEDIYIKFEPYKKSLQRIEEVNIESLVNALPSFLQSLFEGRVLSPKTRSYVLNQAITLLKIVDEQRYDEGTKKYLKYNIVYAIEYSLAMAKRNLSKEKTTVLSPSNRPLLELLSTMQGDNEVEIKGAITFPHLGNENSEDIQNLHAQIEAIIETPRDPSYKKAAEYLNQIIEKAKSLALLGDNLMQIRNYWEFEDKVYEIVKGWADMVESIKTPFILAFKTSSQHDELANIQAVIISKILKPQLIVFGEMLLSTTLLIPEITAKDNQSSNDISKL